jgi:hypothetical protein
MLRTSPGRLGQMQEALAILIDDISLHVMVSKLIDLAVCRE